MKASSRIFAVFRLTLAGMLLTAGYPPAIAQSTKYQSFILHTGTALEVAPDDFAFALAPNRDLFIIKKRNTATKTTEIHVLSASSGYKQFSLQTGTALEVAPDDFDFALASNLDLFAIKKRNTATKTTEIHVLSAALGYKQFSLQTGTALEVAPDDFDFALAPNRDLFIIKKRNTRTSTTEVHVLSAALEYKQFSLHTGTALEVAPDDFAFALAAKRDLFAIKKRHTGTSSTEVHVLSAPDTLGLGLQCPSATNETSFDLEQHGVLSYKDGDIRVVNVFWAPDWDSIAEHQPQGSSPGFLRADINAGTKALIGSNFFNRACQYGGVPFVFNSEAAPPWGSVNACSKRPNDKFTLIDLYTLVSCLEVSEGTQVPHAGGAPTSLLTGGGICTCGSLLTPIPCFIDKTCLVFPNATGNLLLNVFIPANRSMTEAREITAGHGQVPSEAKAFVLAFSQGRPIYVTYYLLDRIIARAGGVGTAGVGDLLNNIGHEMVESLTNPNAQFWFDDTPHKNIGQTEIADYCVSRGAPLTFTGTQPLIATMQSYWSNGDKACVTVDDQAPLSTVNIYQGPNFAKVVITAEDLPADRMAITDQDGVLVAVKAAVGVQSVTYGTDTGISQTSSTAKDVEGHSYAEFLIDHVGVTTLTFFATDLLGHQEAAQTVAVVVKK
jgi:hypothetical protein